MAEVAESQFKQMTIDSENAPPPETPSAKKAPAAGGGNLRDQLQDKIIARMEKEKGRTLTKHEMTTTIKALMKYNSKKRKSLKKRENKKKQKTEGEGAEDEVESEEEEIDFDMDEDELEAFKARKSKTQTYQNNTLPKRARMHLRHAKNKADRLLKIAKRRCRKFAIRVPIKRLSNIDMPHRKASLKAPKVTLKILKFESPDILCCFLNIRKLCST